MLPRELFGEGGGEACRGGYLEYLEYLEYLCRGGGPGVPGAGKPEHTWGACLMVWRDCRWGGGLKTEQACG